LSVRANFDCRKNSENVRRRANSALTNGTPQKSNLHILTVNIEIQTFGQEVLGRFIWWDSVGNSQHCHTLSLFDVILASSKEDLQIFPHNISARFPPRSHEFAIRSGGFPASFDGSIVTAVVKHCLMKCRQTANPNRRNILRPQLKKLRHRLFNSVLALSSKKDNVK
jgi:hypothetical protein